MQKLETKKIDIGYLPPKKATIVLYREMLKIDAAKARAFKNVAWHLTTIPEVFEEAEFYFELQ